MASRKASVLRRFAYRLAMGFLAGIAITAAMAGQARAGCSDGACGRVDWSEVTDTDEGAPAAAKLHGTYAWEASPDYWATHPIAGVVSGYYWLTCRSPMGSTDAVCRQQLATEMSKAGTNAKLTFGGTFFDRDAGVNLRPVGLFGDNEPGQPVAVADVLLGGGPINPDVCRAAFGMLDGGGVVDAGSAGAGVGGSGPGDAGPGGTGTGSGGAGPSPDTTTGGAAGANATPSDDGGCSISGRRAPANAGFVAFLFMTAAIEVARRRSRD